MPQNKVQKAQKIVDEASKITGKNVSKLVDQSVKVKEMLPKTKELLRGAQKFKEDATYLNRGDLGRWGGFDPSLTKDENWQRLMQSFQRGTWHPQNPSPHNAIFENTHWKHMQPGIRQEAAKAIDSGLAGNESDFVSLYKQLGDAIKDEDYLAAEDMMTQLKMHSGLNISERSNVDAVDKVLRYELKNPELADHFKTYLRDQGRPGIALPQDIEYLQRQVPQQNLLDIQEIRQAMRAQGYHKFGYGHGYSTKDLDAPKGALRDILINKPYRPVGKMMQKMDEATHDAYVGAAGDNPGIWQRMKKAMFKRYGKSAVDHNYKQFEDAFMKRMQNAGRDPQTVAAWQEAYRDNPDAMIQHVLGQEDPFAAEKQWTAEEHWRPEEMSEGFLSAEEGPRLRSRSNSVLSDEHFSDFSSDGARSDSSFKTALGPRSDGDGSSVSSGEEFFKNLNKQGKGEIEGAQRLPRDREIYVGGMNPDPNAINRSKPRNPFLEDAVYNESRAPFKPIETTPSSNVGKSLVEPEIRLRPPVQLSPAGERGVAKTAAQGLKNFSRGAAKGLGLFGDLYMVLGAAREAEAAKGHADQTNMTDAQRAELYKQTAVHAASEFVPQNPIQGQLYQTIQEANEAGMNADNTPGFNILENLNAVDKANEKYNPIAWMNKSVRETQENDPNKGYQREGLDWWNVFDWGTQSPAPRVLPSFGQHRMPLEEQQFSGLALPTAQQTTLDNGLQTATFTPNWPAPVQQYPNWPAIIDNPQTVGDVSWPSQNMTLPNWPALYQPQQQNLLAPLGFFDFFKQEMEGAVSRKPRVTGNFPRPDSIGGSGWNSNFIKNLDKSSSANSGSTKAFDF